MKTREQERMARAHKQVVDVSQSQAAKKDDDREKYIAGYGNLCMDFPVLVRSAGLCQAVMFVHTREKDYADAYLGHLDEHLKEARLLDKSQSLLDVTADSDLPTYMLLTREVLACSVWLKRFAQSILKIDPAQRNAS